MDDTAIKLKAICDKLDAIIKVLSDANALKHNEVAERMATVGIATHKETTEQIKRVKKNDKR